jgi:Fe-S-cluster containining protein
MNHAVASVTTLDVDAFREALHLVYDAVDAEVAQLSPLCQLSGRCCRFAEYDHTLFVSAPEFALLLADAPPPVRPLDDGLTCPWQDERGRCTARSARPLGCRVYFCDPAYQPSAPGISEHAIHHLKRLIDERGLPWDYAPLHQHLRQAQDDGEWRNVDAATSAV